MNKIIFPLKLNTKSALVTNLKKLNAAWFCNLAEDFMEA